MKKRPLLNRELSALVAAQGHGDLICIADAGLPVPQSVQCIDLSVMRGIPSLIDVLNAIETELQMEAIVLAEELPQVSPDSHQQILDWVRSLEATQNTSIEVSYLSHESFKARTLDARAIVRTGECTPYVNVILSSGVPF